MNNSQVNRLNIVITLVATAVTVLLFWQWHDTTRYSAQHSEVTLSLYAKTHLEALKFKRPDNQLVYCEAMLSRYHREVQQAWLANIIACYQSLNSALGDQQAHNLIKIGLQNAPNDIAINLLQAQSLLKEDGIHAETFRQQLNKLLDLAPTHRTTLWLASAEAYYRGERSQALAYLTQLRSQVGDEPEILQFIQAVKELPN